MYQLIKLSQGNNASRTRQQINPFLGFLYTIHFSMFKEIQNSCKQIFFKNRWCLLVSII